MGDHCEMLLDIGVKCVPYQKKLIVFKKIVTIASLSTKWLIYVLLAFLEECNLPK